LDTLISEEFHQRDTVEFGAEFADRDRRRARIQRLDDLHLRLDDLDDELADLGELQAASVPVAELELVLRSAAAECRTAAFPSEYFR
jgi:hypothetical protein